jgi:hypothetical protein
LKNFGTILLKKEILDIDGTKFILQGKYSKKELHSNMDVINFFSAQTFQNVYANNIAEDVFDKYKEIFMAIVNLVKYLSNETVISEAFREVLIMFHDLFKNISNNILYMSSLAEERLRTIEEYNVELCEIFSTIEAEKLFLSRSGPHYNQVVMNYRRNTNFDSGRYNFLHEVIINRNLQKETYENEDTGEF